MGLDITWYRNLTAAPDVTRDEDGEPMRNGEYASDVTLFYENPDFPGRAEGLECSVAYLWDECGRGPSWSYSGYSRWREQLATLAGYNNPHDLWTGRVTSGPFYELINFSDCEGTIGPVVAAKLVKDFEEFAAAAAAYGQRGEGTAWWHSQYLELQDAFTQAAQNGAVKFS